MSFPRTFFASLLVLVLGSTAAMAQSYTGYTGYAAYETPAYTPAPYYAAPQTPAYTPAANYAGAPVATYTSTTYYAAPQAPAYTPAPAAVTYYAAPQAPAYTPTSAAVPYYETPQPASVAAPAYPPVHRCHHRVEQPAVGYQAELPVAPAVTYQPVPPPALAYQPLVQPTVAYQPVVQPAVAYPTLVGNVAPQIAYRPIARYQPYVAATYVTAGYGAPAAMASVPGAPRVVVHPKVYVQGEPIRNLIKAVTP